jgi:AcrR family transcriptional regulator
MSAAPPRPSVRRPPRQARSALITAGLELARAAGPAAIALREATRRVGVVPNAAYRHFADRADAGFWASGAAVDVMSGSAPHPLHRPPFPCRHPG